MFIISKKPSKQSRTFPVPVALNEFAPVSKVLHDNTKPSFVELLKVPKLFEPAEQFSIIAPASILAVPPVMPAEQKDFSCAMQFFAYPFQMVVAPTALTQPND